MIRPKVFVAKRAFLHGRHSFRIGDVVPPGRTLAHVINLGGFVKSVKQPPTPEPTTPEGETSCP